MLKSKIAQREASIIPNKLDNYLQNKKLGSIGYMDDTVFFCDDYNMSCDILNKYIEMSNKLNIFINSKKTIYRQRRKLRKMIKNNVNIDDIKIIKK